MIPIPRCPGCGGILTIVEVAAVDPQTSPWGCYGCGRGFWEAELTPEARPHYRPQHLDFGVEEGGQRVRQVAHVERDAAFMRGAAVTEDHLRFLSVKTLQSMVARTDLDPQFLKAVVTHLAGRGVTNGPTVG